MERCPCGVTVQQLYLYVAEALQEKVKNIRICKMDHFNDKFLLVQESDETMEDLAGRYIIMYDRAD